MAWPVGPTTDGAESSFSPFAAPQNGQAGGAELPIWIAS